MYRTRYKSDSAMTNDEMLGTEEAAKILGIGPAALRRRQVLGIAPKPAARVGWCWVYRRGDVEAAPRRLKPWQASQ